MLKMIGFLVHCALTEEEKELPYLRYEIIANNIV